jgi:prepilin-type processing-associated H-X9-DG protein
MFFEKYWYEFLDPYIDSGWPRLEVNADRGQLSTTGVHLCPGFSQIDGLSLRYSGSYGYNRAGVEGLQSRGLGLGGKTANPAFSPEPIEVAATKEQEIVSPSGMIAIGDSTFMPLNLESKQLVGSPDLSPGLDALWFLVPLPIPASGPSKVETRIRSTLNAARIRHSGRWNTLFCDGHVVGLKQEDLFALRSTEVARRWNKDAEPHEEEVHLP